MKYMNNKEYPIKALKHLTELPVKGRSGMLMVFTIIMLFFALPLSAVETWPTTEWVGFLSSDWTPSLDAEDQSSDYLDIVADDAGYDSYFYATSTTLFFRIGLRGSPVNKKNELLAFAWYAPIDVDGDLQPDWSVMVGGISESLETFYDPTGSGDPSTQVYVVSNPVASGDVRAVPSPMTNYPDFNYVEVQVPFTALQAGGFTNNIDYGTPIRMFFMTSSSESMTIKDGTGGAVSISGALGNSIVTGGESLGFMYDTRDTAPYSSAGSWLYNETITVSGYGWPTSASTSYFNGGVRAAYIKTSDGTTVWTGSITTDANGDVSGASTWTATGSYTGGECRIYIEHPSEPGSYYPYDTFIIADPPATSADLSITKSVSIDSVYEGSSVDYTLTITNSGSAAATVSSILDTLPAGLSYVSGSSTSLTSSDPTEVGDILTWNGSWNIPDVSDPFNYVTLVFSSSLDASAGDNLTYPNKAGVAYDGTEHSISGETAPVKFLPPPPTLPNMVIAKAASADTIITSTNLSYTITITNNGQTDGSVTSIEDILPAGFVYVSGSSTGLTTTDPSISGQTLTWSGAWTVNEVGNPPNSKILTFNVTASSVIGDFDNNASVSGSNFTTVSTGATATVTVEDPPASAYMIVTKTAANDTIQSGSNATYTIGIENTGGSHGNMTSVLDSLPEGFTYVTGSTSGLTTSDPSISGRQLVWSGSWSVNKSTSTSLTFSASSAIANQLFYNVVYVNGSDFDQATSGLTAPIRVLSPELSLTKTVDVVNALPGDTLTYTVNYFNTGDDNATQIIIHEIIPTNTTFVENSAIGTDMTITYSHDGGSIYDALQTEPVTNVKFEKGTALPLGGSGSIEFKVRVPN